MKRQKFTEKSDNKNNLKKNIFHDQQSRGQKIVVVVSFVNGNFERKFLRHNFSANPEPEEPGVASPPNTRVGNVWGMWGRWGEVGMGRWGDVWDDS